MSEGGPRKIAARVVHSRRALLRRLLVAELLAPRGEGPLAPRFATRFAPRPAPRGKKR